MRAPIFVWEPNDLIVFDSVERAEAWIEPYDVADRVVYDADGRLLAFALEGPGRVWERRVVLHERESRPTHEGGLRTAIVQASEAAGRKLDPSASLEELVEEALMRFGAPEQGRWRRRMANALRRTRDA